MLIRKEDAKEKSNSDSCSVKEYDLPDKSMGFAIATINGRFPESGKVINTECDEMYFILSGNGTVHTEKGDFKLKEGDVFFLDKTKPYWVDGNKLVIAATTTPPWYFEQHKLVD